MSRAFGIAGDSSILTLNYSFKIELFLRYYTLLFRKKIGGNERKECEGVDMKRKGTWIWFSVDPFRGIW